MPAKTFVCLFCGEESRSDRIAAHIKAKHTTDIGKMLVKGYASGDNIQLKELLNGQYDRPVMMDCDEDAEYWFGVTARRFDAKTPVDERKRYRQAEENMKQHEAFLRECIATVSVVDVLPILNELMTDSDVVKKAKMETKRVEAALRMEREAVLHADKKLLTAEKQIVKLEEALGLEDGGYAELERLRDDNRTVKQLYQDAMQENTVLRRRMEQIADEEMRKYALRMESHAVSSAKNDEEMLQLMEQKTKLQKENDKLKLKMEEKVAKGVAKALAAEKKKKKAAAKKIKIAMAAADSDSDSDSDSSSDSD